MSSDDEKSLDDCKKTEIFVVPSTRRQRSESESDNSCLLLKKRKTHDANDREEKFLLQPQFEYSDDQLLGKNRQLLSGSQCSNDDQKVQPNLGTYNALGRFQHHQFLTSFQATLNNEMMNLLYNRNPQLTGIPSSNPAAQITTGMARNKPFWNPTQTESGQSSRAPNSILPLVTPGAISTELFARPRSLSLSDPVLQILRGMPLSTTSMAQTHDFLRAGRLHANATHQAAVASCPPNLNRPGAQEGINLSLPVILAIPEDKMKLSRQQLLLRHQIEAFKATNDDVSTHTRGRNKPVMLGQVGIRCRHCAHIRVGQRQKGSTYFPASLVGLYQASQKMSVTHIQCGLCNWMPQDIKHEFSRCMPSKAASSGAGRLYWVAAAKKIGLIDTDGGIRFIADKQFKMSKLELGTDG